MSVLRHSPEEYAKHATVYAAAAKHAAGTDLAHYLQAKAVYYLALMFESMAYQGRVKEFRRNDPKTS